HSGIHPTSTLMVRSIAQRCVSNHRGLRNSVYLRPILRDALAALGLLRMRREFVAADRSLVSRRRAEGFQAARGEVVELAGVGEVRPAERQDRLRHLRRL